MQRCEDCIHKNVCLHKANIQTDTYAYMGVNYDTEKCEHYKTYADVAEVVRCKDCKYWCIQEGNDINQSYFCSRDKMWCMPTRKADDFCSYGERKE